MIMGRTGSPSPISHAEQSPISYGIRKSLQPTRGKTQPRADDSWWTEQQEDATRAICRLRRRREERKKEWRRTRWWRRRLEKEKMTSRRSSEMRRLKWRASGVRLALCTSIVGRPRGPPTTMKKTIPPWTVSLIQFPRQLQGSQFATSLAHLFDSGQHVPFAVPVQLYWFTCVDTVLWRFMFQGLFLSPLSCPSVFPLMLARQTISVSGIRG